MILSTRILGETFIWQYDLIAMLLIATGSVTIVIHAHTEQVEFTAEEIKDLLLAPRTVIYLLICTALYLCEGCMLRAFYKKLRLFEEDALAYEDAQGLDEGATVSVQIETS